jgi:hypothetical protein
MNGYDLKSLCLLVIITFDLKRAFAGFEIENQGSIN